jgi:hypothetical protein
MKDVRDADVATEKAYETWLEKTGGFARDMTLRDHFAGLAMPWVAEDLPVMDFFYTNVAAKSYELADAMLKERAK